MFFENSGFEFNGFPSVGVGSPMGLGSITDELPAYVVLPMGEVDPWEVHQIGPTDSCLDSIKVSYSLLISTGSRSVPS